MSKWPWAVMAVLLMAGPARAEWTARELESRLSVAGSGAGQAKIEVSQGEGQFFAVALSYEGPGLPGGPSLALDFTPPKIERFMGSHVLQRVNQTFDPYWTQPQWGTDLADLHELSTFVIWKEAGRWGAMIPLVGGGMQSRLEGRGGKVRAQAESLAPGYAPKLVPMIALGFGDDPYRLVRDLYAFGLSKMRAWSPGTVLGRPRWEKPYPEVYRYVGWCSWNAYYDRIDEAKLVASTREFKAAGFPLRFVLIDDCWMQVAETKGVWANGRKKSLSALEADPAKFPQGLGHTVDILKKDLGISWVGVWMTFQGYWNGIKLDTEMARKLGDALMPVTAEVGIPNPKDAEPFWDAWFTYLQGEGIDYVKVDNQSTTPEYVLGRMPATEVMSGLHRGIQAAARKHFGINLLNCMSLNVDSIYQWSDTNLARASIDTWPRQKLDPRHHAVETVTNALWLSNLAWPDYDMWQTHGEHNDYHAVGRAISGGPLYVADEPGRLDVAQVWPLIYQDGEVIRPEEPGLPARRTLLSSPYTGGEPMVAFCRAGKGGALAAWNVHHLLVPVSAELSPAEVEGIAGGSFAVYDWFAKKVRVVPREGKFPVRLPAWGVAMYSVAPVQDGFAALGLVDKYLSVAAVKSAEVSKGKFEVTLRESGIFAAWCRQQPGRVTANGKEVPAADINYVDGLLRVNLPRKAGETVIVIE